MLFKKLLPELRSKIVLFLSYKDTLNLMKTTVVCIKTVKADSKNETKIKYCRLLTLLSKVKEYREKSASDILHYVHATCDALINKKERTLYPSKTKLCLLSHRQRTTLCIFLQQNAYSNQKKFANAADISFKLSKSPIIQQILNEIHFVLFTQLKSNTVYLDTVEKLVDTRKNANEISKLQKIKKNLFKVR